MKVVAIQLAYAVTGSLFLYWATPGASAADIVTWILLLVLWVS